jgi:hypothetical protein
LGHLGDLFGGGDWVIEVTRSLGVRLGHLTDPFAQWFKAVDRGATAAVLIVEPALNNSEETGFLEFADGAFGGRG